tara:strand:+ start:1009 stop:3105 length:2097 start_codon:yes stop_codon:yes gene_type:complete
MKLIKVFAAILLTAPLTLVAQIDRSQAPEPGPAPIIELGESTVTSLENGLKVIVVENHRLPQVSWSITFEHTPISEGNKVGMLGMFGDMMRAGTSSMNKAELDEAIDFIGGSIWASSSSISGSSLTKHSNTLLDLMTDIMFNPSFPEEELNKLKTQALSGLAASETSPNDISSNLTRTLLYGADHPYGGVTTSATLEAISQEDFVNHHSTYFKPNIAYLVVVGDITPEAALEVAESRFGSWTRGKIPYQRWETPALPEGQKVCLAPLEGSVQSLLKLTHIVNIRPGSTDAIAASVMNSILGGGAFSGRLMQNLREDKAFTYGARSSLSSDPLIGSFTAYADVRNEVTDSSVTEFIYEIKRMLDEQVDDASLSMTKSYMTGSFARSLESPRAVARFALNIERYNLPQDYYSTYLEKLNAVTVEDIQRVAKKYLKPDQIFITCVGSPDMAELLAPFSSSGTVELYDAYGQRLVDRKEAPEGTSVESVAKGHYNATGGLKKHTKLKSVVKKGSMEIGGMMTLGYENTTSFKKGSIGSHTSISMSGQSIVEVTVTPHGGSQSQMGPKEKLEGNELVQVQWKELSPTHLLDYVAYGVSAELLGIENIDGVDHYALKYTGPAESFSEFYYFNVETGILGSSKSIVETEEGPMTSTSKYNNYIKLNSDVVYPLEVLTKEGPQSMNLRISTIDINTEIDTNKFNLN